MSVRFPRMIGLAALWVVVLTLPVLSQTTGEIVAQAAWTFYPVGEGVVIKTCHFDSLFGGPQDVHVTDADMSAEGVALRFAGATGTRRVVSAFAASVDSAAAAINGNWFDPNTGVPIQFTRIDGQIHAYTIPQAQERGGIIIHYTGEVACMPRPYSGWESVSAPNVMASEIPLLVNGQPYPWTPVGAPDYDYYYTYRHPRSAIGVTADNHVLFVVVDGRRSDSIGASYAHMAELMAALGAVNSTNLDGGGSSTCWGRDYGILNQPSDGRERAVADALVITAPPVSTGPVADIIIESRPGGKNFAWYSEAGTWANSGADCVVPGTTPGIGQRYGSTYRSVAGAKAATFRPVIPYSGDYEVFVAWGAGLERRSPITHKVGDANGLSEYLIDQSATANSWVSLESHRFSAGSEGFVEVSNEDIDTGGNMYAAAAKFVPVSLDLPAVVVNGVSGEDDDGLPPFETLQAAVSYCITWGATDVEVQTDGPMAGFQVITPTSLPKPLTVRAGAGYRPTITTNLSIIPANSDQQVTLEGLHVELPNGLDCAAWIGCNLKATRCTFKNIPGEGGYHAALTACTGGSGTTSTLILKDCVLSGHNGLQAGRSVRDYVLRDCFIEGKVSDLDPHFSYAITNNMNWSQDFTVRLDSGAGLATISEPRTLRLERCTVKGGTLIGWPAATLPSSPYVENEVNTMGPIVAVNCVFQDGDAVKVGHAGLPTPNAVGATFQHCTWRASVWGAVLLQPCANNGTEISNCLFDMPFGEYVIGDGDGAGSLVAAQGDGNLYNVPGGREYVDVTVYPYPALPPFEPTTHISTDVAYGGPYVVADATGHLGPSSGPAFAKAVALVPAVTDDFEGDSRPLPTGAAASDIGADEFDEGNLVRHYWRVR